MRPRWPDAVAVIVLTVAAVVLSVVACLAAPPEPAAPAARGTFPRRALIAVDLDGDGTPDHLVVANGAGQGRIHMLLSSGRTSDLVLRDAVIVSLVATDIDGDGDPDLIAATDAGLAIWVNDGRGRFARAPPPDPAKSPCPALTSATRLQFEVEALGAKRIDIALAAGPVCSCELQPRSLVSIAAFIAPDLGCSRHSHLRGPPASASHAG